MVLLFVYGTLQHGLWNNFWMNKACYISIAKTRDKYSLYVANRSIPMVNPDENKYQICGELYSINEEELSKIDQHEGVGTYYTRELIDVVVNDNITKAYIYMIVGGSQNSVEITNGNFKDYIIQVAGDKNFVDVETIQKYNNY